MGSRWRSCGALVGLVLLALTTPALAGVVGGELKKWHTVTVDFQGPQHHELDTGPNPFLDYRLQVIFSGPSGQSYSVPGFFDGDGNGGATGRVWRVRFAPDQAGVWSYQASFRAGSAVAVSLDPAAGVANSFNGETGTFTVQGTDVNAPGFLRFGRLESIGDFYLKFRDGGYWVKTGINNPENLLGYRGFDNTPNAWHSYAAHVVHWNAGDPNWDSPNNPGTDDGKGIIGALNYLAAQGMNSIYFLPMNIGADAMDTWPYADPAINRNGSSSNDNRHFDISKLRQWGIVLDHAQRKGLFLHFVLSDKTVANKTELDNATLGVERKLFYRELIARFGHHNALQWNISEEYNLELPLDPDVIKEFAQYIRDVDPYNHPVTVHPHGNTYREALAPFIGDDRFRILSVQTWQLPDDVQLAIKYFRQETAAAGQPVPVNVDEHIGMNQISAADYRKRIIWDALFSGGGMELFKSFGDSDLDNFTVYEEYMRYARFARKFVEDHLPFWQMAPAANLVTGENTLHGGAEVFVKGNEIFAIFLPNASPAPTLSMGAASGVFKKQWFNPRTGELGSVQEFNAAPTINLGSPPSELQEDWVILIRAVSQGNAAPVSTDQSVIASVDTPVTIPLAYTDPDGPGPYTFTVTAPPQHGTLSPVAQNGTTTYTPQAGFAGTDTFSWRVHDGVNSSAIATVTVLVSDAVVLFRDDFNRAASAVVGNGWSEQEASGASVQVVSGGLEFTQTSDLMNRPMVSRAFSRTSEGFLEWEFLFNWSRTGTEGTYRLFMQLGDGSLMSTSSSDAGVGVNLIWTAIGGVNESLGYRRNGATVALAQVSGLALIKVTVDFAARTYMVSINNTAVGQGIPFDQGVGGLDTIRFFTDALNHPNFAGRRFDDVQIHHIGSGTNQPPVALNRTATTLMNTATTIQLQATDADNDPLQYLVVSAPDPAHGTLQSNDGDSTIIYVPTTGFTGVATFTFKANDGTADSNVAVVTVTVNSAGTAPDQIHLAWVEDPATTLTVVWRTLNVTTPSAIEYRPVVTTPCLPNCPGLSAVGSLRTSGTSGTLHEVTLRQLTPATAYEYRVQGDGGVWSPVFVARTAPPRGPADFTAVYVADTGLIGRLDGLATGTAQVVSEIAALQPTLVLPGGDYAYFDTDQRYGTLDNTIDVWFNQMQPIAARAPLMPTYGNHEADPPLLEGFAPWAARFPTPAGFDGRRYYSFDVGDVHFVSIFATNSTQGLPSAALQWIQQDILAAKAAGQRWIIPYFHVSPFADGLNHPSNLQLRAQLGPLFEQLGVKLVLVSHDQAYERTYPLVGVPATNTPTSSSLSCYTMNDGVTWAKISPGGKLSNQNQGFSQFATNPPPAWTAVRNNTLHHFARLVVSASGSIKLDTYGVNGNGSPPVIVDSFQYLATGSCPGELAFEPSAVALGAPVGGTATAQVNLTATTPVQASVTVSAGSPWLTVSPVQGMTPRTLTLTANASGLAAGTYTATVTATAPNFTADTLAVTLTVSPSGATHTIVRSAQANRSAPTALAGAQVAGNIYVFVTPEPGVARVRFYRDLQNPASDPGGTPEQTENTAPYDFRGGTVTAANPFDTGTLSDGLHTITAAIDLAAGGTEIVFATFTVANNAPALVFSPDPVTLSVTAGGATTAQATVTLNRTGTGPAASFTLSEASPWLTVSPGAGTTPGPLTLTANASGLAAGTYTATVTATAPGFTADTLAVTLTVSPSGATHTIVRSAQANRSAPTALAGAQVAGNIYVFVTPETGVARVRFYRDLQNPANDPGGTPEQTENTAPYDFAGGTVTAANAFNTAQLPNGSHTITAAIDLAAGGTEVIHATFTVANP